MNTHHIIFESDHNTKRAFVLIVMCPHHSAQWEINVPINIVLFPVSSLFPWWCNIRPPCKQHGTHLTSIIESEEQLWLLISDRLSSMLANAFWGVRTSASSWRPWASGRLSTSIIRILFRRRNSERDRGDKIRCKSTSSRDECWRTLRVRVLYTWYIYCMYITYVLCKCPIYTKAIKHQRGEWKARLRQVETTEEGMNPRT